MNGNERLGDDEREVAKRLEAYADARLRPDPVAMTRVRSAVVAEARRQAPIPFRRRPAFRYGLALLAAAALLVAIVGSAFAASRPGGPLYGARLWVESTNLPSDPSARAEAQMARLDVRLQELRSALAAHDEGAAAAALDGYRSILDETLAAAPASSALEQRLEAAIGKHLAVLQALLATAPAAALDGLRTAIDRSDNALQVLERRTADDGQGPPSAPPGQATTPPGQRTTPPGQATTPPGQQKSPAATTPPGQATTPPGQATTPPGQQTTPPGQQTTPPGQQKSPTSLASPVPAPSPSQKRSSSSKP